MNLIDWVRAHPVPKTMSYEQAYYDQIGFMDEQLVPLLARSFEKEKLVEVIATHTSKSILLPVLEVTRPDLGLRFTFRNNFYNWKFSVLSETRIDANFTSLFHTGPPPDPSYTGNPLASVYFEGFPKDRIYGYYQDDPAKFSGEIWDDYALWAAMYLILDSKRVLIPCSWPKRALVAPPVYREGSTSGES